MTLRIIFKDLILWLALIVMIVWTPPFVWYFAAIASLSYQLGRFCSRLSSAPKSNPDNTIIAGPMDDRYGISCFSNGQQHSYFFRTGQLETLSKRVMADAANPDHPLSEKLAVQILERCYVMVSSYEKNGATL